MHGGVVTQLHQHGGASSKREARGGSLVACSASCQRIFGKLDEMM